MLFFLAIVVMIWGIGNIAHVQVSKRLKFILAVYVLALAIVAFVPETTGIRQILDGSIGEWFLLAGVAVLVWGYLFVLRNLKGRAVQDMPEPTKTLFSESELDRYARHIVLREIGGLGQKKLKEARVLVIGAGGLGSPVLLYLAAAGVGHIGIVDDDVVDNSNLQRQVLHSDDRIDMPKVQSAKLAMLSQNPNVDVKAYNLRLDRNMAQELIGQYDLVLDGTDNFATRYLVNQVCVDLEKPLIAAALTQWEGQISLYDPANEAPCYQCVFPQAPADGLAPSCAEAGVLGPLPGVVGSMMAVEAVKEITGVGEGLRGRLMIYDALYSDVRVIKVGRKLDCECCKT